MSTITPYTDAARESVKLARDLYERRASQDPVELIRERMSCDVNEAVMIGLGELLDCRQCTASEMSFTLTEVFASAAASVTLTVIDGDEAIAMDFLKAFVEELHHRAQIHLLSATSHADAGSAEAQPAAGRA